MPPERLAGTQHHHPEGCRGCGRSTSEGRFQEVEPWRHQIAEIPEIQPEVTEHVLHGVLCLDCNVTTTASLPEGVPASNFGANLRALLVLLSGRFRISRRETTELCKDVFGLSVSVGAVANVLQRTSKALADPWAEVARAAKQAPVAHMDETGWKEKGKSCYLWILATDGQVLFRIGRRTKGVAQEMLGTGFKGCLVVDRYCAYKWFDPARRQVCWAHLRRDFQGLVDRGGAARRVGDAANKLTDRLFKIWHLYKEGKIGRTRMRRRMARVETEFGALLEEGTTNPNPKASSLCKSLLETQESLFVFARFDGVEPTNNTAERGLRPAVQWRKICFGTQSDKGSVFVERILTVVMTCRQRGVPLLSYLRAVILAQDCGEPIPSLLSAKARDGPVRKSKTSQAARAHRRRKVG